MNIEDVYAVLNEMHALITGNYYSGGPIDTSQFVSVANKLLQQGTDVVYNALMNTITKTIFSTRPYSKQFGGLIVDTNKWGGIIRKIQFGDTPAVADKAFTGLPADGSSVDHYVINRGEVLETRYYGSTEYQDVMTVFRDQLIEAMSGPEQLGSFIAAKANEVNNKWVQWTEDLARGLLINAITAKVNSSVYTDHVIHLLTEYNGISNQSLTYTDIFRPANAKPFWEFVRARIKTASRSMTLRSDKYQYYIYQPGTSTPYHIFRHTPESRQKLYLTSVYVDLMETSTLTEAFHNDYLKYTDFESVARWQYWDSGSGMVEGADEIYVSKYVTLNETTFDGSYSEVTPSGGEEGFFTENILGVLFDEDFASINIKDTIIQNTPLNARGLYFNTWLTAHAAYLEDFTEKFVVFLLD